MDVEILSRLQFAITIGFHFLFPPISIGLAWLLVVMEWKGWRTDDEAWLAAGKFFSKLLALTFVVGVATGIVMEFQFGTNWSRYSEYVGDIFGAPLAAEGIFAFFMESAFLGLYLFGRKRVSKALHWFSILMVAVGATISAFWIIVANSWQQTPAGYVIQNGRAELTDFWAAVFNPSTMLRYFHTVDAAIIAGAFFVGGISALLILRNKRNQAARHALRLALWVGLFASLLECWPFGHEHVVQVANTQPEKFAAMEGLYMSQTGAPLAIFGFPVDNPPVLKLPVEIPNMLSFLAFGDFNAHVQGINEFPKEDRPPLWLTFVSFHNMVILGTFFVGAMALGVLLLLTQRLWDTRWFMKLMLWSIPLPLLACQFGWVAAEVGRQPWVVYKLMRTSEAFSPTVSADEVLFSIILFSIIYLLLGSLYIFLLKREIDHHAPMIEGGEA